MNINIPNILIVLGLLATLTLIVRQILIGAAEESMVYSIKHSFLGKMISGSYYGPETLIMFIIGILGIMFIALVVMVAVLRLVAIVIIGIIAAVVVLALFQGATIFGALVAGIGTSIVAMLLVWGYTQITVKRAYAE